MKLDDACIDCLINQSRRVADALGADEAMRDKLVDSMAAHCETMDMQQSPPEVASAMYADLARIAGKADLYDEVKRYSTDKAAKFIPALRQRIAHASDPLLMAIKSAVAGNVIDLAAEVAYDLDEELEHIFGTTFAINDYAQLAQLLERSKTLLYIGDNAGEHLFDYLCIETMHALFPSLEITYMTRGAAIINDITYEEAAAAGFSGICHLQDSGVDTPGFVYARANEASRRLFDTADLVITKGMGNYECLSPAGRANLFYLLKVKCNVVSRHIGADLGAIVCKMAD